MGLIDVKIPDIGDFADVPIVEIQVKPGDVVKADDPLLTLESDKAAMDVPAPQAGRIVEVVAKIGDKVSEGSVIVRLETDRVDAQERAAPRDEMKEGPPAKPQERPEPARPSAPVPERRVPRAAASADRRGIYAGPAARRLARELDLELKEIAGTGEKGRITKDDVKRAFIAAAGGGIPAIPAQDFSRFGPVEVKPLSRLRKLSGPVLHRAWLNVPHVTHWDEADITVLEHDRKTLDATAKAKGVRVTLLAFVLKASAVVLKEHPEFNASLGPDLQTLILKRYYNIGVAVDTADGLVVPLIKDVDRKSVLELSRELGAVSARMRDGRITPTDIQGATFSISSLGGIGGAGFTPIVNAPEVAILGVARAAMKPVWDGSAFQPRLMLPLCVSYDHRVIDGAQAARFTRRLAEILADTRQLSL